MGRLKAGLVILFLCTLCACGYKGKKQTAVEEDTDMGYTQISQEEAKKIMDERSDIQILDVRSQEEYDAGHIKGALVLPHTEVLEKAESMLSDKNQTILVYCRSGYRSKLAAEDLVQLGYTDVEEFGGIMTWEYGTVIEE